MFRRGHERKGGKMELKIKEYVSEKMEKAACPMCENKVFWLRPHVEEMTDEDATFFICYGCQFIGQIGVNEVQEAKHSGVRVMNWIQGKEKGDGDE